MFLDSSILGYVPRPIERRATPRQPMHEEAELVIPSEDLALPCRLLNMSADGAGIRCDAIPRAGTKVRLILRDGRAIEAVTVWFAKGQLGLSFTP